MLQFTYKLKLTERVKAKCNRHPRYNPEKDGRAGIRGGCSTCFSLYDLHQARLALDAAQREFVRRAGPWARRRRTAPEEGDDCDGGTTPSGLNVETAKICFMQPFWPLGKQRDCNFGSDDGCGPVSVSEPLSGISPKRSMMSGARFHRQLGPGRALPRNGPTESEDRDQPKGLCALW